VELKAVTASFGVDAQAVFGEILSDLESSGLLERRGDTVRLTSAGRLLSNEVFQRFIALPSSRLVLSQKIH